MYLHVNAHTPVGTFLGAVNPQDLEKEVLIETRDNLEAKINEMAFLVLFANGTEIVLPGAILKNSVLVFSIADWLP